MENESKLLLFMYNDDIESILLNKQGFKMLRMNANVNVIDNQADFII